MVLNGTGVLKDTYHWVIYGKYFQLLPQTLGRTIVGLDQHSLVLPAITELLTPDEKAFFQKQYLKLPELEELKSIASQEVDGNKVGMDISQLRHQAEHLQQQPLLEDHTVIGAGVSLVTMVLVCVALFLFRKPLIGLCASIPFRRRVSKPKPTKRKNISTSDSGKDVFPEVIDSPGLEYTEPLVKVKPAEQTVAFVRHTDIQQM